MRKFYAKPACIAARKISQSALGMTVTAGRALSQTKRCLIAATANSVRKRSIDYGA